MIKNSWQLEHSYTELPVMFYEFQSPEPARSPKKDKDFITMKIGRKSEIQKLK